jgi:hypothetical protein
MHRYWNWLLSQTRDEIAALPASSDVAPARIADALLNSPPRVTTQPHTTFYPQSPQQANVYEYPASSPPRNGGFFQSNFSRSLNNANPSLTSRFSLGANTATGNLGPRIAQNNQAPVYNLNPYSSVVTQPPATTNSRSPVEQQRSSTIAPLQQAGAAQFSIAQQAQAQAIQLARLAQIQQQQAQQTLAQAQQTQAQAAQLAQASQPTTVFRQAAFVQPTLGLASPQFRAGQSCTCTVAYNPAIAYGLTETAMRVPAPTSYVGNGLGVAPLTLENMPAGTYFGPGIVGQPTAYRDGQPIRNLFRYITP